jgi:hypothetical protein
MMNDAAKLYVARILVLHNCYEKLQDSASALGDMCARETIELKS